MRQRVESMVVAHVQRGETKPSRQTANPRAALRNWPVRIFPVETPCITTALLNSTAAPTHAPPADDPDRPFQISLPAFLPYRQLPRAQTPQQRAANARYARREEGKMGKPLDDRVKRTKQDFKSPIGKGWIIVLGFVLAGGAIFELLKLFF
ncbi:hypothetical protein P171DRAFT_524233 [Karstenula rhodostoma CBS 690.94]|uniref:Stress-associated endoplasmic reticulum protein n=1 Tax=Karstenula rhodostoma CBS 690.94 TaxID=1392251 RepID=A0A9P4U8J8_9PLEO|nr:hypothetical protein P171DRAFT_524233 [Karstenula rhodostoma CBS 690.94]